MWLEGGRATGKLGSKMHGKMKEKREGRAVTAGGANCHRLPLCRCPHPPTTPTLVVNFEREYCAGIVGVEWRLRRWAIVLYILRVESGPDLFDSN